MRSVCWQLLEYALGRYVTHGDHQCCNKMKPCSFVWAIVSNSTSWIFQSIQLKLLVNMCHEHSVVPSVANGKSVKSRTPLMCCSVVESLFLDCELKSLHKFEILHSRLLKVSQLWIMLFYDLSLFTVWLAFHLEWILKHHWFIASRARGTQIFQKSRSHLKILHTSSMIWSKFSYCQSTIVLQYKMLLPSQPCALYLCTPALESMHMRAENYRIRLFY